MKPQLCPYKYYQMITISRKKIKHIGIITIGNIPCNQVGNHNKAKIKKNKGYPQMR
jgi:hypothetical protein